MTKDTKAVEWVSCEGCRILFPRRTKKTPSSARNTTYKGKELRPKNTVNCSKRCCKTYSQDYIRINKIKLDRLTG